MQNQVKKINIFFKSIAKVIILFLISSYLLYCCFYTIIKEARPTYVDSGKIVSKSSEVVLIKSMTTLYYFDVDFTKKGTESIRVDEDTYFKFKVGDTITYELPYPQTQHHFITWIIGATTLILLLILFIMYIFFD